MAALPTATSPKILLGPASGISIAASIYGLVERGAMLRPELARQMRGSVLLRFTEGYEPVHIDLRGDEIAVADASDDDRAHDLLVEGALPDVVTLIAAPLLGGLPKPTTTEGRAAIARLAEGSVELDGPLRMTLALLRLLSVAPQSGRQPSPATPADAAIPDESDS
jgi:hypothetical protein